VNAERLIDFKADAAQLEIVGAGAWTALHAGDLEIEIERAPRAEARAVHVDMSGVREFDTFGAWILERLLRCEGHSRDVSLVGLPERFQGLFDKVRETNRGEASKPRARGSLLARVDELGHRVSDAGLDALGYLGMIGALAATLWGAVAAPRRLRFTPLVYQLDRVGLRSVPIIVLITLLIGAIIAQQGIFYFRRFGAGDYVVDLVAVLILRELGVLMVAIMVAGRCGSSYTAELGAMTMREEVDALRTMGRDPVEILILPRVLALVIALPLLTLVGSAAAMSGGGLVALIYGGMEPGVFVARLREAATVSDFAVGMIKAPIMALAIGIVACTEGMKVKGSAESLGKQTTTSVVKSIFAVIVMDGMFAIFFSSIGV